MHKKLRNRTSICAFCIPSTCLDMLQHAANNAVLVWRLYYINTLKQDLSSTKTYKETWKKRRQHLFRDTVKKIVPFFTQFKYERLTERLQAVICHIRMHSTYLLIKPFLARIMSISEEYGAFNKLKSRDFIDIWFFYTLYNFALSFNQSDTF